MKNTKREKSKGEGSKVRDQPSYKKRIEYIEELVREKNSLDVIFDDLSKVFTYSFESPLFDVVYKILDSKIVVISELIGDEGDWISWYLFDNKSGEGDLTVKCEKGGDEVAVKSAKDLLYIIDF